MGPRAKLTAIRTTSAHRGPRAPRRPRAVTASPGDRKLENDKTLEELQIEKEEVLDAVFSIAPVQCAKKDPS